jgi:hypothetical protein
MEAAQNRLSRHVMIARKVVSAGFGLVAGSRIGDARSEARMGSSLIVVRYPLFQNSPHVPLVPRDHEIETFPSHRANQPFTESVGMSGQLRRMAMLKFDVFE